MRDRSLVVLVTLALLTTTLVAVPTATAGCTTVFAAAALDAAGPAADGLRSVAITFAQDVGRGTRAFVDTPLDLGSMVVIVSGGAETARDDTLLVLVPAVGAGASATMTFVDCAV